MKRKNLEIKFGLEHLQKSFTSSYKKKIGPLNILRLPSGRSIPKTYGIYESNKEDEISPNNQSRRFKESEKDPEIGDKNP